MAWLAALAPAPAMQGTQFLYWYKSTNTDAAMLLSWLPLLLCKALARDDERQKDNKKNAAAAAATACSALAPDAAAVDVVRTRRELPLEQVPFFYDLRRWHARAPVSFFFWTWGLRERVGPLLAFARERALRCAS